MKIIIKNPPSGILQKLLNSEKTVYVCFGNYSCSIESYKLERPIGIESSGRIKVATIDLCYRGLRMELSMSQVLDLSGLDATLIRRL